MRIPAVFLLLAAGLDAVLVKYFEIGGEISLESLPVKEAIAAITWKHKGNFVAEWVKDKVPLTYFGDFQGRTDLNTTDGKLTIRAMKKADEGDFTVEVNQNVQSVVYSAKGIVSLREKKVEALFRPLTCNRDSPQCTLSCEADVTDVGPVRYFWKQEEDEWKESPKNRDINNDGQTRLIKTFSCKIKNLISEKESEPLENIFKASEVNNGGLVGGIVVLLLLIIGGFVLCVFAYKYPHKVAPCIPCVAGHPTEESREGGETQETTALNTVPETGNSNGPPVDSSVYSPAESHRTIVSSGPPVDSSVYSPAESHRTIVSSGPPDDESHRTIVYDNINSSESPAQPSSL